MIDFSKYKNGDLEMLDKIRKELRLSEIGEISDGYNSFNELYEQIAILFAMVVNTHKDKSWKSWKHHDGSYCSEDPNELFLVGIDTPSGQFSYYFEADYYPLFMCEKVDYAPEYDGHVTEDISRLFSLI